MIIRNNKRIKKLSRNIYLNIFSIKYFVCKNQIIFFHHIFINIYYIQQKYTNAKIIIMLIRLNRKSSQMT